MRRLILAVLMVLLLLNGWLLWQNLEQQTAIRQTCSVLTDKFSFCIEKAGAAVLPGLAGIIQ